MDYQIAHEKAQALFTQLGLGVNVSSPVPNVQDNWPNIAYSITFVNGKINSMTVEYHLGVGHVTWPKRYEEIPQGADVAVFNTLRHNPGAQLKNKMEHAIAAALLARVQKVSPKTYEVLATICNDSLEAHNNSFEDWASNFGFDPDSRKAETIYRHACHQYHELAKLIGADNVKALAELACNF